MSNEESEIKSFLTPELAFKYLKTLYSEISFEVYGDLFIVTCRAPYGDKTYFITG